MSKETIIGIDLGTTNSCVAVMEGGSPKVIPNSEGDRTTPSMVAYTSNGILVGAMAKRQAITNSKNTVYGSKRFIGKNLNEFKKSQEKDGYSLAYDLCSSPSGDTWIKTSSGDKSPEEIGAQVLKKLKKAAEDYLGHAVNKAVITVPAYFNDQQREATRNAGKIAGLEVVRIINEPTAAALAYGFDKKGDSKMIVYDLGGGTFDVSVLEKSSDGALEVCSTNGDTHLGGEDFDNMIIEYVLNEGKSQTGIDLKADSAAMQRIKEAAEKSKIDLSSVMETEINLPYITADSSGPKHLMVKITRAKFESMVTPLIERSLKCCKAASDDAKISNSDLDEVILVGGQTRMPAVQEAVKKFFGKEPNKTVNPDEVVALGAAIQGGILAGDVKDILLLDVTPLSLGIETLGGVFTKLIERNTTIPTKKSQVFSTAADNQTSVSIVVYQGERSIANENKLLGSFTLDGIPSSPRGVPQIEVSFEIDANGIVNVSAKDLGTGKEQRIRVESSGGLSKDEIENIIRQGKENEESDKKKLDLISAKNEADSLIYSSEKTLKESEGKVSAENKESLEKAVASMKEALSKDELDAINAALSELRNVSMKVGEEIYKNGSGGDSSGGSDDGGSSNEPNENPQEAEFKEKK